MMTAHYGNVTQDMVFYPWGDEWLNWGGGGLEFADLAYDDTNLNVDFTEYRAMSNNMGRWHSPDPLGGDISNPQSLNRYALCAEQSGEPPSTRWGWTRDRAPNQASATATTPTARTPNAQAPVAPPASDLGSGNSRQRRWRPIG